MISLRVVETNKKQRFSLCIRRIVKTSDKMKYYFPQNFERGDEGEDALSSLKDQINANLHQRIIGGNSAQIESYQYYGALNRFPSGCGASLFSSVSSILLRR
jgi:hypothetical protein